MRALVLSGGGSRGAFQVGVLKALCREQPWYDVFCGISVGAINSAWLAQHTDGSESMRGLEKLWRSLTTSSIYKNHFPFGYIHAMWEPSVYDTSPLSKLVNKKLDVKAIQKSGKLLRVGAVSLQTYDYRVWDEKSPNLAQAILASSAYPVMFPPQEIDAQVWTDGGVHTVTPIKLAIDLGATHIDVVLAHSPNIEEKMDPPDWAGEVGIRVIDILGMGVMRKDLQVAKLYNELVAAGKRLDKRHVPIRIIEPNGELPGSSLKWDSQSISEMIDIGYLKGLEALKDG